MRIFHPPAAIPDVADVPKPGAPPVFGAADASAHPDFAVLMEQADEPVKMPQGETRDEGVVDTPLGPHAVLTDDHQTEDATLDDLLALLDRAGIGQKGVSAGRSTGPVGDVPAEEPAFVGVSLPTDGRAAERQIGARPAARPEQTSLRDNVATGFDRTADPFPETGDPRGGRDSKLPAGTDIRVSEGAAPRGSNRTEAGQDTLTPRGEVASYETGLPHSDARMGAAPIPAMSAPDEVQRLTPKAPPPSGGTNREAELLPRAALPTGDRPNMAPVNAADLQVQEPGRPVSIQPDNGQIIRTAGIEPRKPVSDEVPTMPATGDERGARAELPVQPGSAAAGDTALPRLGLGQTAVWVSRQTVTDLPEPKWTTEHSGREMPQARSLEAPATLQGLTGDALVSVGSKPDAAGRVPMELGATRLGDSGGVGTTVKAPLATHPAAQPINVAVTMRADSAGSTQVELPGVADGPSPAPVLAAPGRPDGQTGHPPAVQVAPPGVIGPLEPVGAISAPALIENVPETPLEQPRIQAVSSDLITLRAAPSQPVTSAAAPVIQQVQDAISLRTGAHIEVTLAPEELGRLRMTLSPQDSGMSVTITAERPETLDLLRRHSEQLADAFREAGYDEISFQFGAQDGADNPQDQDVGPGLHSDPLNMHTGPDPVRPEPHRGRAVSGLDLRL